MSNNGPLWRALALAGLMAGGAPAPVLAAQADIDFLGSYLGDWKGRGKLQGANRAARVLVAESCCHVPALLGSS